MCLHVSSCAIYTVLKDISVHTCMCNCLETRVHYMLYTRVCLMLAGTQTGTLPLPSVPLSPSGLLMQGKARPLGLLSWDTVIDTVLSRLSPTGMVVMTGLTTELSSLSQHLHCSEMSCDLGPPHSPALMCSSLVQDPRVTTQGPWDLLLALPPCAHDLVSLINHTVISKKSPGQDLQVTPRSLLTGCHP